MGDPVLLRNASDSWVNQGATAKNYSQTARIQLGTVSGNARRGFFFFARPWPAGATILSAKIGVYNTATWSGSRTLTLQRVADKWSVSRVTWANQPGVTGSTVAVTKTGATANTLWEFDVTSLIQQVSDGAAWWGFRIISNGTAVESLYSNQSREASGDYRPYLEVTWSDAPDAPEELYPGGGRIVSRSRPLLRFNFTDVSGNTSLAAVQVQTNSSDSWTTPAFDSGEVATSVPELDLATTAFVAMTDGQTVYWRVRVKDGAGIWSEWSEAESFTRQSKGTLTLDNPAASPNNFIYEPTPPVFWTLTGRTQRAYQVYVAKTSDVGNWLWTSGKITSTDSSRYLPAGVIDDTGETYRFGLRVWDTLNREGDGDPIFYEVTRDVTYSYDNTVGGVTSLAAEQDLPYPWVTLTWNRSTAPDSFVVTKNGKVVEADIEPASVFVSGTSYSYTVKLVEPRVNQVFRVLAVVNGKSSQTNPSVSITTRTNSPWLMRADGSSPIIMYNYSTNPQSRSVETVHEPIGGSSPVLITQYIRGYEGDFTGRLADGVLEGVSARVMRDRFKSFLPGEKLILHLVDEVMKVVIYNKNYLPVAKSGNQVLYDVSFSFFEVS